MSRAPYLYALTFMIAACDVPAEPSVDDSPHALAAAEPANCRNDPEPAAAIDKPVSLEISGSPIKGNANAPVTIVVFSDFECPYCKKGADRIHELEAKYPSQVRFVFKHLPLPFHERARPAALAAVAAQGQGKFWELHDRMFADQHHLDPTDLEAHAKAAGLDAAQFKADLDSPATVAKLEQDGAEARRLGVTGTPTFFINGKRLTGAQPVEKFAELIDVELGQRR